MLTEVWREELDQAERLWCENPRRGWTRTLREKHGVGSLPRFDLHGWERLARGEGNLEPSSVKVSEVDETLDAREPFRHRTA